MTLRKESRGKKQSNVNAKTICKLDHLKNLAIWAAKASIPPLGAFFGERLAATSKALDFRADPSFFVCGRCETLMQPGLNCTVCIEKNRSEVRHRHKKLNIITQNNVVYRCHLCSHQNVMRGTPKGYLKEISSVHVKNPPVNKVDFIAVSPLPEQNLKMSSPATPRQTPEKSSPATPEQNLETSSPAMPLPITGISLLDSKQRKRKRSGAKKLAEPETIVEAEKSIHALSKRKKKLWTSLKEIAEGGGHVGNKFEPSSQFPNYAMEGATKWDPDGWKPSDELKQIFGQTKPKDNRTNSAKVISALEAELEQARSRINELEIDRRSSNKN